MRLRLLTTLISTGLMLGGCSHLGEHGPGDFARGDGSRLGNAETVSHHAKHTDKHVTGAAARSGWAPIEKVRGGPWADMVVTPVSAKGPHAVAHADGPYLLDTGDQLRIFVYGQPNLSRIYKVDHTGNIMVPLIGVVKAQRRTTYRLADAIRARLGAEFVRDPQVTVDIHENRPFFILGEVRSPGQYPYVNGMTIETAVAIAGGYTARASEREFRISRRVDGIIEIDKGSRDYVVQPGDTVRVVERFF